MSDGLIGTWLPGTMSSAVKAARSFVLPGTTPETGTVIDGALGTIQAIIPGPTEPGGDGMDAATAVVAFQPGAVPAYADVAGPVVVVPLAWLTAPDD